MVLKNPNSVLKHLFWEQFMTLVEICQLCAYVSSSSGWYDMPSLLGGVRIENVDDVSCRVPSGKWLWKSLRI